MIKAYPEYKNVNNSWFKSIPANWDKANLNHVVDFIMGQAPHSSSYNTDGIGEIFVKTGDFGLRKPTVKWFTTNPLVFADESDVFICVVGATAGKVNLGIKGTISRSIAALRAKEKVSRDYLYYFLDCNYSNLNFSAQGSAQGIINKNILSQIIIPLPSLPEQEKIAAYLDNQTKKIDSVIAKKERLLELLEEKKKSLINDAVTGKKIWKDGHWTRPDKTKDSGIEWLGEIPEDWEVKKLKHLTEINSNSLGSDTKDDYLMEYVDIGSVSYQNGIEKSEKYLFKDAPSRARRLAKIGDTILSTVRTYLKAIAFIDNSEKASFVYSTGFAVISPININSNYLNKYLKSESFLNQVEINSKGIGYPAINSEDLKNIIIVFPIIEKQEEISQLINSETSKIDLLNSKLTLQIEKLKEYRQALISEAVSGQVDLRLWNTEYTD